LTARSAGDSRGCAGVRRRWHQRHLTSTPRRAAVPGTQGDAVDMRPDAVPRRPSGLCGCSPRVTHASSRGRRRIVGARLAAHQPRIRRRARPRDARDARPWGCIDGDHGPGSSHCSRCRSTPLCARSVRGAATTATVSDPPRDSPRRGRSRRRAPWSGRRAARALPDSRIGTGARDEQEHQPEPDRQASAESSIRRMNAGIVGATLPSMATRPPHHLSAVARRVCRCCAAAARDRRAAVYRRCPTAACSHSDRANQRARAPTAAHQQESAR